MKLALYLSLILLYLPLLMIVIKNGMFFKSPFYVTYFYSVFFLNVVGSCIIFFPKLNIYGISDLFSIEFYWILILQVAFFYLFLPFNSKFKTKTYEFNIQYGIQAQRAFYLLLVLTIIIILLFYVRFGLPPLYTTNFSRGSVSLMASRVDFFENIQQVWFYRIGLYVLPQVAGVVLYLRLRNESAFIYRVFFLVFSTIVSIVALSFLHKTPVILFWFSIFIAKILADEKANLVLVLKWSIGLLLLIVIWYLAYFPGRELDYYADSMMRSVLNRIFGVYPLGLAMSIEITKEYGFFYGTTMNNPLNLIPYEVFNLSKLIHLKLMGAPGNHPAPALGYAYADFGWYGVVVTSYFIHLFLLLFQVLVNTIKNRILYIALVSYLSLRVLFLSMSSVSEVFLNVGELITLVFILITYFLSLSKLK